VGKLERYCLEPDRWLSGVLSRPAWRVVEGASGTPLEAIRAGKPQFATAKVPASDPALVGELEQLGFHVVDAALTFAAEDLPPAAASPAVRFAAPGDRGPVEAVAGSAFRYSRFHLDPRFPRELADRIKAQWAGNWFLGQRGDGMIVAEDGGRVAGFLQLLRGRDGPLVIDLIAVEERSRGRGLARAMIAHAAAHGTGDGRRTAGMIVGTQAANVPSVRLYESLGFRLRDAQFVLHHHGEP